MSFTYEEKRSSSPHVDIVWRTEDQTDGVYVASADACWDMVFIQNSAGKTKVLLSGPSSKTTQVPYSAGNKNFGVRFKPGVIFTNIPVTDMVDVTTSLTYAYGGYIRYCRGSPASCPPTRVSTSSSPNWSNVACYAMILSSGMYWKIRQ